MSKISVIGGGLAGTELSYQLASLGLDVTLYEPRVSGKFVDEVHKTRHCAELVCSNSLRSNQLHNAAGLLKQELRIFGSVLISIADKNSIPAGSSLAVSREDFSRQATKILLSSGVKVLGEEVTSIDELLEEDGIVVVASGPLSSPKLSSSLKEILGVDNLYFYDAIAPLVRLDSLDMNVCFRASRYTTEEDSSSGDYVNLPLSKEEYYNFVKLLAEGEKVPFHKGEQGVFFKGCMPVEVMAENSMDSLRHGPMRGDGLKDPKTGKTPYAAIQFRQDSFSGDVYNMVGFQSRLKYGEQKRIFASLKGASMLEFERFGSMHRNTYINAPTLLNSDMSLKNNNRVFMAGQISGVEGYVESIAHGMLVASSIIKRLGKFPESTLLEVSSLPSFTAIGSLKTYLLSSRPEGFQPMKSNFGIFPPLTDSDLQKFSKSRKKRDRREAMVLRSIDFLKNIINKSG